MPGLYGFDDNKLLKEVVGTDEMRDMQERVNTTERTLDDIKTKVDQTIYSDGFSENPEDLKVKASSFEIYANEQQTFPYIDFHFNGSTTDYTSRIIESMSGVLQAKPLFTGGPIAVSNVNLDNAPFGFSVADGGAKNNPFTFWVTVLTVCGYGGQDARYRQQIAYPWGSGEANQVAYRVMDQGKWSPWKYIKAVQPSDFFRTEEIKVTLNFQANNWNNMDIKHYAPTPAGYKIMGVTCATSSTAVTRQVVTTTMFGSPTNCYLEAKFYSTVTESAEYTFYVTLVKTT